jgi:hypothetical protein
MKTVIRWLKSLAIALKSGNMKAVRRLFSPSRLTARLLITVLWIVHNVMSNPLLVDFIVTSSGPLASYLLFQLGI